MWHKALVPVLLGCMLATGCSQLERLTIIRPSAKQRSYTQVAPTYDVSGKKGHASVDPELLLASAADMLQRGQLDEAERLARKALATKSNSGDANTLIGAIADARGDSAAAGKAYYAAAAGGGGNGGYANNYGGWLCANGRAAESLEWFDRALADPAYATPDGVLANAGACAHIAGQEGRAEASWRRLLALNAQSVPALAGLAELEFERGNGLEARAFAERWLALSPDDADGLRLAAKIEQKLGDNVTASRYLSRLQAISSGPTTVPRTQ